MKRLVHDATASSPENNVDAATSPEANVAAGGRTQRLRRRRPVSPRALQNLLFSGILGLAVAIVLLYSRLTAIDPNRAGRGDLRRRGGGAKPIGPRGESPPSIRLRRPRGDDGRIPGRGRGSARGRVECDRDVSRLVSYWSDPRSDVDRAFRSPFLDPPPAYRTRTKRTRYLSFEPDLGGWNNIRMEFEIMVVLASATGRTLVLPPDNPLYLLHRDRDNKHRGVQHFFHGFDDIVDTISTEDFFKREMLEKKTYPLPRERERVMGSLQRCYWMKKHDQSCIALFEYLSEVADLVPKWHGEHHCLIMDDEHWFRGEGEGNHSVGRRQQIEKFCAKREPVYYDREVHDAPLLHFHSHFKDTRLLLHFYAFIHFTDPKIGNHYRRLVRDRVRYSDEIFCAAGKIVGSLLEESSAEGASGAGYFAMHIRRGDFQWPKMRISAEEWFENTRSWLSPGELLYIATDETNRTWFEPLTKHYPARFLDDYSELAGLPDLDPNYVGMIDQVVASRSRVFVGTYFSSFSAFIGRMRGYHGLSGKKMYYSHPDYWNETHGWAYPHSSYSAREYPLGWVGIDGDDEPSEKDFY